MDYDIKKVIFKIRNFDLNSINIINSKLKIYTKENKLIFTITNYLGKGATGQVYLIESQDGNKYVIKIANTNCDEDIIDEVHLIYQHFKRNKINHKSYPLYYGKIINLKTTGIIYNYFGFYNLEKIKFINYKIDFQENISIIKQIIEQLISLTNIIHCDLKPSNIVIDKVDNKIIASIIDFGLIKGNKDKYDIISTNYITSPESLLTLDDYLKCFDFTDNLSFSKHDYFGLFIIIINLFLKKNFWSVLSTYFLDHLKFDTHFLQSQESSHLFVYTWFRLFHKNKEELENQSIKNLIEEIEKKHNKFANKNYMNYDDFFKFIILQNINFESINSTKLVLLKDFIKKIIQLEPKDRPELTELLEHPFIKT